MARQVDVRDVDDCDDDADLSFTYSAMVSRPHRTAVKTRMVGNPVGRVFPVGASIAEKKTACGARPVRRLVSGKKRCRTFCGIVCFPPLRLSAYPRTNILDESQEPPLLRTVTLYMAWGSCVAPPRL